MINYNKLFSIVLVIFQWLYRVLMFITPVYFILSAAALYWQKNQGQIELWQRYFPESWMLFFSSIRFYIWYKILYALNKMNSTNFIFDSSQLQKLSILFLSSFIVDLISTIHLKIFQISAQTDWSFINWPQTTSSFSEQGFDLLQMFFKLTVLGSGFVTPTVFGLSNLFIALICFVLSKK